MNIKKFGLVLLLLPMLIFYAQVTFSYDRLNPPYPRTSMFNMAPGNPSTSLGTRHIMLSWHDMAQIYGMTDNGGDILAAQLKQLNPNIIVIASGINSVNERDPLDYFLYRSYRGHLTEPVEPNQEYIKVDNTANIHAGQANASLCYIRINNDLIKVRSVEDATTLRVYIDTNERWIVSEHHDIGATLMSPIRVSGPGIYPNFSQYTTLVDGKSVWKHIAEENFFNEIDWQSGLFDGLFHDWFTYYLYISSYQPDFDLNGVDDFSEHSNTWMGTQWRYGLTKFVQLERAMMDSLTPSFPNLYGVNTGGTIDDYYDYLNGHQFEGFQRFSEWTSVKSDGIKWMNQGQEPSIMSIFDYFAEKHFNDGKNRFDKVRFGLTTAMMFDMYYGLAAGDTYYLFYWYDEFETDIGYPVGDFSTLANGVLVRYFDKGVALCNPTGANQLVTADMLTGGPYYRLKGGQDPVMNSGELFTEQSIYSYNYGPKNLRGDGMLLFKEPTTSICDIIVDNFFMNYTSPGSDPIEFSGSWTKAVSAGFTDPHQNNPYWSQMSSKRVIQTEDYLFNDAWGYHYSTPGSGSNSAVWKPTIGQSGWYEVSEWHGWHGDTQNSYIEASNVPFEIGVGAEVKIMGTINQTTNIGQWNRLGFVYLNPGKEGYVKITNNADGYVIADAMKFKYMGNSDFIPDSVPPASPTNVRVY